MRVRVFLLAVLVMALFPVAAQADYPHVVQPGETLTSVAAVDGLNIEAIAAANGISPQAELVAGQILMIPPQTPENAATASTVSSSAQSSSSDTTEEASEQSGAEQSTTQQQTSQTEDTSYTQSQTSSSESTGSASPGTITTTTTTSSPGTSSSSSAGGPVPTAERVSSSEIASVAAEYGVPAPLAEAIAWQESGWNNDEVSGVGAVGVMQIVPTTWDWIDRYLTPSSPLGTASAAENIRAGVLLLHQLLSLTGGNEQMAVAGYYQGLASVEAHGMYADTQRYVADVLALTRQFGG